MALTYPQLNEGEWNLIVSNVVTGYLTQLKSSYRYFVTHVKSGATAPLAAQKKISPALFEDGNQDEIESNQSIDIYVWPENSETKTDDQNIENAIEVSS